MTALGTPVPTGQAVAVEGRVEPLRQRTDDLLSAARDAVTPAAVATMARLRRCQMTTGGDRRRGRAYRRRGAGDGADIVPSLLAAFGTSLLATNTPVAPAHVPVLWGLLAWVRRRISRPSPTPARPSPRRVRRSPRRPPTRR